MNRDDNLIDYPCSYSWRAYYEETMNDRYLPPLEPIKPPEDIVKHITIYEHSNLTDRNLSRLENTEAQIISIKKILNELTQRRQPKGQY